MRISTRWLLALALGAALLIAAPLVYAGDGGRGGDAERGKHRDACSDDRPDRDGRHDRRGDLDVVGLTSDQRLICFEEDDPEDADSIGVHTVSLVATTSEGEAIGSRTQFSVRTSNVGTFVWFVVGGGAAVLALAIVIRLVRRIRAARAGSSGSDVDTDRTDDAAAEPGTVPTTSATVGPSSTPTNAAEDVATGTAKPVEGATP